MKVSVANQRLGIIPPQVIAAGAGAVKNLLSSVGGLISSKSQSRKLKAALAEREAAKKAQPQPDYAKYAIFAIPAFVLLLILKRKGKKADEPKFIIAR